eukprot:6190283-Pyramimonas_sp.AAC.1
MKVTVTPRDTDGYDGSELAKFWGLEPRFWHISFMMYNPYMPIFQEMDDVAGTGYEASANPSADE